MSMRLDQALVIRALCESRTEAQELIEKGYVTVNGLVTTKQTRRVEDVDTINCSKGRDYVSRGGNKLEGALSDIFHRKEVILSECAGKIALDVGASTGGFTDCLLQCSVAHVDAVDVGTSQIHHRIAKNAAVSVFENTNILDFKTSKKYDIIVADLSFTKLSIVLKCLIGLGKPSTLYLLLIKPQFEVGKGNTKKGIVKNLDLVEEVLNQYRVSAEELGLTSVNLFPCVIRGGDGNQEYFLSGILN